MLYLSSCAALLVGFGYITPSSPQDEDRVSCGDERTGAKKRARIAVQEKSGKKLVDFNAALGEEANRTLGLRPSLSPAQA